MAYYIDENGTRNFMPYSDLNSKELTEVINRSKEIAELKKRTSFMKRKLKNFVDKEPLQCGRLLLEQLQQLHQLLFR